jgi:3'(2'), 5'-bisphosphate nucleotidase
MQRELDIALSLARQAGEIVVGLRTGGLDVEMKPGDEPVTLADRTANEWIVRGLAAAFPNDAIISEELPPSPTATGAPRLWWVDPIDGTKDFIRGGDGFSVMIGLALRGRPVVGVVHQPTIDRTFYATPDGAFVDESGERSPLTVSKVVSAGAARLVASASHRTGDIDRVKSTLGINDEQNVGSVGVKLGMIAMGIRDLYINPRPKSKAWDTCAPEAILTQAGGKLSDLFGEPIGYGNDLRHRRGLVASNGRIHDEVIAKISPLFATLRNGE